MKKWLLAFGAFLAAIGFAILQRPEKQLRKTEEQRDGIILDGSRRSRDKAENLSKKADKLQADAVTAAEKGKEVVDSVGKDGQSMGDMLDSWRKPSSV